MKTVPDIGQDKQKTLNTQNTYNSMKFITFLANCFALLPVDGGIFGDLEYLNFRWKSFKILYSAITLLAAIFTLSTGLMYLFKMSSFEMIGIKITILSEPEYIVFFLS